jgi:superoxide reductase
MTQLRELYHCKLCGHVVEVVVAGAPALVCCGEPMEKLTENTQDAALEKHVPVLEETPEGLLVKVGSVAHPMVEEHYIQFIEVMTADKVYRAELKPGMAPEAVFPVAKADVVCAREYCNLHGAWKS